MHIGQSELKRKCEKIADDREITVKAVENDKVCLR